MLANYLIGLREGLEAALVVVILLAALTKSGRSHLKSGIWIGVATAVLISLAFGAALTFGPKGLTFEAQELIGGGLSILAVCFVSWMIFWMASHAKSLSGDLRAQVDAKAEAGRWGMAVVALLAVGREGLETALFLWAAVRAAAGTSSTSTPVVGAFLGLLTAVALGWLINRGALKLNLSVFFTWTGAFLVLVAGGVLAYAMHDLQEAGLVPGLNAHVYDISHLIAPTSVPATVLKGIFNFTPTPTIVEFTTWWVYVVPVMVIYLLRVRGSRPRLARSTAPQGATS